MMGLLTWLFPRREQTRKVLLVMFDKDMKIVTAHRCESGWIARWIKNDDQWSLLLPGGEVQGTTLVKRWLPYSGWDKESEA